MPRYRVRVKMLDLITYDRKHGTSLVGELEMMVDGIVTFDPCYSVQFFRDVSLYGLDEARTYLIAFIDKNWPNPSDFARDVAALTKWIDDTHLKCRQMRDDELRRMAE